MKSWFSFRALSDTETEVAIYDVIGLWGVTAKDFASELQKHAGKDLTVRINSPGGDVTEGYAMFNALNRHKGNVTVQIDGLAASMATYVALAGSKVRMAENAFFMIHNVSGGVAGDAKDLRSYLAVMERMQANIVNAYVAKTGKDEAEIERLMDETTWFTAQEAQDYGFVDEVTDRLEAAATAQNFDLSKFKNLPSALANFDTAHPDMDVTQLTARVTELESQLSDAQNKHTAAANQAQTNFAQLGEARNQITALTTERDNLRAEVDTLKAGAKTAGQRAVEIAASVGVPPVDNEHTGSPAGTVDVLAHYRSLPANSAERQAYFKAHKAEIFAAMNAETNAPLDRSGRK